MKLLNICKKVLLMLGCFIILFSTNVSKVSAQADIGVIFVIHGGMAEYKPQLMWDAAVLQFSFDHNHSVYKLVNWNSDNWSMVLDTDTTDFALKYIKLFKFEYERIGGVDPFNELSLNQLQDMKDELDTNPYGLTFAVDWAGFQCADSPGNYPYPRFIYYGPDLLPDGEYDDVTYCGEQEKYDVVLDFQQGTSAFTIGSALTGQTSGATAEIVDITIDSGSWAVGDAVGHLSLTNVLGSFEDTETIADDGTGSGSAAAHGTSHWEGCNPERYNVDGPVDRLLNMGVSRIIAVDWMMGGPRYSKNYDVVEMIKRAIDDWNAENETNIPDPVWINDYTSLMSRSFPTEPEGWTAFTFVPPTKDSHILLNGGPNPIISDPELTTMYVEAIEEAMSPAVSDADTGVIFVDHSLHAEYNQYFDPKVNDSLIIHKNIKAQLLIDHPDMDPNNIIGSWLGLQEVNPENGLLEHNREMRGEVYGKAWLYETEHELPGDEWGYRAWDGFEYLKDRGVQHMVIVNAHLGTQSVLDMVEMPNQIGRELGIKTWLKWGTWDYARYPGVGHPFADYWGMWLYTDCAEWDLNYDTGTAAFDGAATLTGQASGATGVIKWITGNATSGTLTLMKVTGTFEDGETITDDKGGSALADGAAVVTSKPECCFEMGGCADPLRPYPPVRQTPLNRARNDLDPSLVYDMSEYGNLGYDPALGQPDPDNPVQDQYTGTWEMFTPFSDDPRVGQMLAKYVLNAAVNPMVYLTNGEVEGIAEGGNVSWEAHVTGGGVPAYTYEWSIKEEGDASWSTIGGNNSTWTWNPVSGDEGTYDVRCRVTDSQAHTGEVNWEKFIVSYAEISTTTIPGLCSAELIYGEHSEQIELLRYIRDNVLTQTPEGQEIIRLYYQWSPAIVKAMEQDEEFKEEMKEMIDGVLGLIGGAE
jgi:hypothetical protein